MIKDYRNNLFEKWNIETEAYSGNLQIKHADKHLVITDQHDEPKHTYTYTKLLITSDIQAPREFHKYDLGGSGATVE